MLTRRRSAAFKPLAIFAAMLGLVALAPRLGVHYWGVWHYRVTNTLYFVPQYVFPFGYTWRPLPEPSPDAHPIGHGVSIGVWIIVAGAFGWLARRLGPGRAMGAAMVVIVGVTGAQQLALRLIGWRFWCDGP